MNHRSPISYITTAELATVTTLESLGADSPDTAKLNLDQLPAGVVSGTTLIDFSSAANPAIRAGVSLSMLFASRFATAAAKSGGPDEWLAAYTSSLVQQGLTWAGSAIVHSQFQKMGLRVHEAIIPFLTVAFGGAAVGPIILAGLKNLQEQDKSQPWITLFDRETRRFDAQELHFAAVSTGDTETIIKYAIARLHVESQQTTILFFKLTDATAQFESVTTTVSANNSLMAAIEPDLRKRLEGMAKSFIAEAPLALA